MSCSGKLPSSSLNSATSARDPGRSVPTSRSSPSTCAGRTVAASITSASDIPRWRNLLQRRREVERRPVDAELMEVGRDHVGPPPVAHHRLGGLERERAGAVADVEDDARLPRAPGDVEQPAVVVDDLHRVAGEAVRQHVARLQERQHLLERGRAERRCASSAAARTRRPPASRAAAAPARRRRAGRGCPSAPSRRARDRGCARRCAASRSTSRYHGLAHS